MSCRLGRRDALRSAALEIVYYAATSLDGKIATPDGGVGWLDPFHGGEDYGYGEFYASIDVLLLGSATYEFALEHPPWQSPDKLSRVFTKRNLPIAHPSIELTAEPPAKVVTRLEDAGHKRAWLMGGGELAASFLRSGLITRSILAVMPVVLGEGIPLFAGGGGFPNPLKLIESKSYPNGVVLMTHDFSSLPETG